jgi:hypothetical protein
MKIVEHPIISKVTSSDTTELLLNEWMLLARHNKKLHDAAAKYYVPIHVCYVHLFLVVQAVCLI